MDSTVPAHYLMENGFWRSASQGTALILQEGDEPLAMHRRKYPRFADRGAVKVFCVPIQGAFHRKLFPEIAFTVPLPLFPAEAFKPVLPMGTDVNRTPGNTIRKVYICRAQTNAIAPGDVLLFYLSKAPGLVGSQSITSVGIAERVSVTRDLDELLRLTAKRSVFSVDDLRSLLSASEMPVKVIDFLLAGHVDPPVKLATLICDGVFASSPPQSITLLSPERYNRIRARIDLGFEL